MAVAHCHAHSIIGLFDGIGTALVSLLSMGAMVSCVTAETDAWLSDAVAASFAHVVNLGAVEQINPDMLADFFKRHSVPIAIVGG